MFFALPVLAAFVSLAVSVSGFPVLERASAKGNNTASADVAAAVPAPPHFVVYADLFVSGGAPPVAQVQGWNVFALAFWLTSGPFDNAAEWANLPAAEKQSRKQSYANAGIKLIVSAFGATDRPTSSDPVTVANNLAQFVRNNGLDGVDVDYEDLDAMNAGDGRAERWLSSFTTQLRQQLPAGQFILTHAPLAPWFSPGRFGGGAYTTVHRNVGNLIDWYNLQYYNQGATEYTTCDGLLTASSSQWPQTAVFQIAANGVPLNKLVIGKPATPADASNGFMSTATLAQCVQQARSRNWNAGVMAWQFPHADSAWIRAVRGTAFP